jgi:hypothetical protein
VWPLLLVDILYGGTSSSTGIKPGFPSLSLLVLCDLGTILKRQTSPVKMLYPNKVYPFYLVESFSF